MGPADLANPDLIPDIHWMGSPGWQAVAGYLHFRCDYRLVNDNLLDLSQESFIHAGNRKHMPLHLGRLA